MTILCGRCYPCEVGKHDSCRGPDCTCENNSHTLHYDGCLVDPGHHGCALKEIEALRGALDKIKHIAEHYSGIVDRPMASAMYRATEEIAKALAGKE